jgi:hypothetical protein
VNEKKLLSSSYCYAALVELALGIARVELCSEEQVIACRIAVDWKDARLLLDGGTWFPDDRRNLDFCFNFGGELDCVFSDWICTVKS